MFAPIHQLLIFGHEKRLFNEFDLLRDFRFTFFEIEFVPAIGTSRQFELDDFIDQLRRERLAKMLLVTFLSAASALALTFGFAFALGTLAVCAGTLRRLDDVRRRRLRRIGRIFPGSGKLVFELEDTCFERHDLLPSRLESSFEFSYPFVFGIHETNGTSFAELLQHQFLNF